MAKRRKSPKKHAARSEAAKRRLARELTPRPESAPPSQSTQFAPTIALPTKIEVKYGSPDVLVRVGPILKAAWKVPSPLEEHLRRAGRPVPNPIAGYMLIDTGASLTCIALDVAQELGLTAVNFRETYGSVGLHRSEVFEALLMVDIVDPNGNKTTIYSHRQAAGIPNLGDHMNPNTIQTADSHPKRLIGLLGREFLRHGTLVYNGASGRIEFVADLQTMQPLAGAQE